MKSKTDLSEYEGTIEWICQSPFRPHHKRKNWFITVKILSEVEAYEDIGKFYLRGHGVKKDLEKAMEYFSKYGDWSALSTSYLEGEDVEQDREKNIK